ncbi:MAG: N-acetylmuramoyl-L-alanine amidase, partial [Desulfatirhabdiaceae bacterium]|nr:N-acetylmuramoyl-L-alanine amidase [Desulfatirhabdiaceae bacterium]
MPSHASTAKEKYAQADSCYHKLLNSPEKQKFRHNWIPCIEAYQEVFKSEPNGPMASAGLYMVGYLFDELYRVSRKNSDKNEA